MTSQWREHGESDCDEEVPPLEWWLGEIDPFEQLPVRERLTRAERARSDWREQLHRAAARRGSRRRVRPEAVGAPVVVVEVTTTRVWRLATGTPW